MHVFCATCRVGLSGLEPKKAELLIELDCYGAMGAQEEALVFYPIKSQGIILVSCALVCIR